MKPLKTYSERRSVPRALLTLYTHMEDGTCEEDIEALPTPEIEMTDIASAVTDLMHLARFLEIDWVGNSLPRQIHSRGV